MPKLLALLFALITITANIYGQVAGRYTDGKNYAVYFEQTRFGLTIKPVLWTATQLLRETSKDKYVVVDRTSRTAEFDRNADGKVIGVAIRGMDGEGLILKRSDYPLLPLELLLNGKIREAAVGYRSRGTAGLAAGLSAAEQVLRRLPTKTQLGISFLREFEKDFKADTSFQSLFGDALMMIGDRKNATEHYRLANSLDPKNERAISALYRLGLMPDAPKKDGGWQIPFPLSDIFAKPTAAEIRSVESDWASRDLRPAGVREEWQTTLTFGDMTAKVRLVSHLVHGSRHYGAIIVPQNAKPGCCGVIVDAKGVSPNYFPLNLEGIESPRFMGENRDRFIYVVPSYRGEILNIGGRSFTSEGDRRDALDGATDDALALLNVALQTTSEIDATRICAYGRSRGGNVALLMGIRDKNIKCVVDVSGPTDWFYLMGKDGWTEEDFWAEGLRIRAGVFDLGGQNIERFLGRVIDGKANLADVRHNMIASSPLYFAGRLPLAQMHYGLEDTSVPSRNGYKFVEKLKEFGVPATKYDAHFYPDQGHDTDRLIEPELAKKFISKHLL